MFGYDNFIFRKYHGQDSGHVQFRIADYFACLWCSPPQSLPMRCHASLFLLVYLAAYDMWPRSRDFGNPQCRQRIYIFGARSDLTSPANFNAMLQYFRTALPAVHGMCGVGDVLKWIARLRKRCPDILHARCKPKAGSWGTSGVCDSQ